MLIVPEALIADLVSPADAFPAVEATFAAMARGEATNFPVVRAVGEGRQYGFRAGLDRSGAEVRGRDHAVRRDRGEVAGSGGGRRGGGAGTRAGDGGRGGGVRVGRRAGVNPDQRGGMLHAALWPRFVAAARP